MNRRVGYSWLVVLALWPWLAQGENIYHCTRSDGKRFATNFPCPDGDGESTTIKSSRSTPAVEKLPLSSEGRRGQYWVEVRLNDSLRQKFLIDTGANQILIPQSVFDQLSAARSISKDDFMENSNATLADGSKRTFPVYRLKSVSLGSRHLQNVPVLVGAEYATPLLGTSVLDRLGSWSIDQEHKELVIEGATKEQDKSHDGNISHCKNLLRALQDRNSNIKEIQQDNNSEAQELDKIIKEMKEREKQISEERKGINKHTPQLVNAWNQKVIAFNKEQKEVQERIDRFHKRQDNRKGLAESQASENKTQIKTFNQKCSGLPYQDNQGTWKSFPTFMDKPATAAKQ